jgi:hypothetical protein
VDGTPVLEEILAKASYCEEMADKTEVTVALFYRQAAQRSREMAAQLELLEREPAYRIIRNRKERGCLSMRKRDTSKTGPREQGLHCGLPFRPLLRRFRKLLDVTARIA